MTDDRKSAPTHAIPAGDLPTTAEIRAVLDLLPVAALIVDREGVCGTWNPAAQQLLGYRPPEVLERSVFRLLHAPSTPGPSTPLDEAVRDGPRDVVLVRQDGRHLHAREAITPLAGRGPEPAFLVTYEDRTDLTHQVERLALIHAISDLVQGTLKLDRLLHVVLTCATAGTGLSFNRAFLFLIDEDGATVRGAMGVGPMNREEADEVWEEMASEAVPVDVLVERFFLEGGQHDSPLDELTRHVRIPVTDTHHPIIRAIRAEHPLVFRGSESRRSQARAFPPGLPASSEFVVAPFIARDRPIGALVADNLYDGIAITPDDVNALSMLAGIAGLAIANARMFQSERRKTQRLRGALQELRTAQERLIQSERLAAIGRLSAHLAHELRNPLTTIGLYARAIEKRWDGGDENRRKLEVAIDEIAHLEEILNQVLDFARPRPPVFGDCDPARLLSDVHRSFAQEAEALGIRTDVVGEPGIPLRADASQLRQVLINLVRNALQAMEDGGYLRLDVHHRDETVRFRVTDDGPGIPEENLESVFEPFFTTHGKGSGLGLAISRKIVQDHGGRIEASSEVGRATTFTITLPVRPVQPTTVRDATEDRGGDTGGPAHPAG